MCHDEHIYFNEEHRHCEDIPFERLADVNFNGEHRSVGSCICHDQH